MESHEDELEEGPLSDLSESNVKSLDKGNLTYQTIICKNSHE